MAEFNEDLDEVLEASMVDVLSESQSKAIGRRFISSSDISSLLSSNNIKHVIIGAHALGGITSEPRATQDVDVVVKEGDYDKTVDLITKTYPDTYDDGNRIKDKTGNVLVDVLTDRNPIYRMVMRYGKITPEMMLVMKFLSSKSPLRRKDKKIQDKADFFNVAGKSNIDLEESLHLLRQSDEEFVLHRDEMVDWIKDAKE
ncbi:MAG: hypothetical protein GF411_08475 [Candidatus Lokiarchaeota archaeon]|nr:hypothetical protein [Candidatus Lokiarchaeota archaeon]